ncbi:uncharacterized protein [Nicotiana tomentosiformis]|uniref:uncharacterized protein n=1 Tax=Nicotiana tomentosiformis TaxID=4098 RepID=UPI00388CA058
MEARVCQFVQGLSPLVINEASTAALNSYMNYGKMVEFAQATETHKLKNIIERGGNSKARSAGNFGGSSGSGRSAFRGRSSGPSQYFALSSVSAQPLGPARATRDPTSRPICYGCGMRDHIQRDCRSSHQSIGRGAAQPVSSAATTSAAPPLARDTTALAGCGVARGGAQSSG